MPKLKPHEIERIRRKRNHLMQAEYGELKEMGYHHFHSTPCVDINTNRVVERFMGADNPYIAIGKDEEGNHEVLGTVDIDTEMRAERVAPDLDAFILDIEPNENESFVKGTLKLLKRRGHKVRE